MITLIPGGEVNEYRGLKNDTKPTVHVPNGSAYFDFETSELYIFDAASSQWIRQESNGDSSALPAVTSADNGKVLQVIDGAWGTGVSLDAEDTRELFWQGTINNTVYNEETATVLVEGERYVVTIDGVEYPETAQSYEQYVVLGELDENGEPVYNTQPFGVFSHTVSGTPTMAIFVPDSGINHTIKIERVVPEQSQGGASVFDVTCTMTSATGGTTDKTISEIVAAANAGNIIRLCGALGAIDTVGYVVNISRTTSGNSDVYALSTYIVMEPDALLYDIFMPWGGGSSNTFTFVIHNLAKMQNVTYSELATLRTGSQLVPGMKYRITDFVTIVNGTYDLAETVGQTAYVHYARSAGHPFDLIVTAVNANTLDEHATATLHSGDTYFANSALEQWDIRYTIENDPTKYAWADATNGKGVITYMKDEFGNEAGYDFKNVQFLAYQLTASVSDDLVSDACYGSVYHVYKALSSYLTSSSYYSPFADGVHDFDCGALILNTIGYPEADSTYLSTFSAKWLYTFTITDYPNDYDASLNYNSSGDCRWVCVNNKIAPSGDAWALWSLEDNVPFGLGATIFENWFTNDPINCSNNTIESNCSYNIFGHNCFNNVLQFNSYGNIIGSNCSQNILGSLCSENILHADCECNTLGAKCSMNILNGSCLDNTLTRQCGSNILRYSCRNTYIVDVDGQDVSAHTGMLYIARDSENAIQAWNPADVTSGGTTYPDGDNVPFGG